MTPRLFDHLLLGVCGSSAATATTELLTQLATVAARVSVIASATAAELFLPDLLHAPLYTDADWNDPLHITLLDDADALLIAPATATTLAKTAAGIADTLLTALILAHGPGVLFYPSMNARMWNSPATRRVLTTLTSDGHHILTPTPSPALTSDTPGAAVGEIPGTLLTELHHHTNRP